MVISAVAIIILSFGIVYMGLEIKWKKINEVNIEIPSGSYALYPQLIYKTKEDSTKMVTGFYSEGTYTTETDFFTAPHGVADSAGGTVNSTILNPDQGKIIDNIQIMNTEKPPFYSVDDYTSGFLFLYEEHIYFIDENNMFAEDTGVTVPNILDVYSVKEADETVDYLFHYKAGINYEVYKGNTDLGYVISPTNLDYSGQITDPCEKCFIGECKHIYTSQYSKEALLMYEDILYVPPSGKSCINMHLALIDNYKLSNSGELVQPDKVIQVFSKEYDIKDNFFYPAMECKSSSIGSQIYVVTREILNDGEQSSKEIFHIKCYNETGELVKEMQGDIIHDFNVMVSSSWMWGSPLKPRIIVLSDNTLAIAILTLNKKGLWKNVKGLAPDETHSDSYGIAIFEVNLEKSPLSFQINLIEIVPPKNMVIDFDVKSSSGELYFMWTEDPNLINFTNDFWPYVSPDCCSYMGEFLKYAKFKKGVVLPAVTIKKITKKIPYIPPK